MGANLVAAHQERAAVIPEIIYSGTYYETLSFGTSSIHAITLRNCSVNPEEK